MQAEIHRTGVGRVRGSDVEALRLYWALSPWVGQLADRVIHHPRDVREALASEETVTYGEIPPFVNARETVLAQQRVDDPCVFVGEDISSTVLSGANHVVAWTLSEAYAVIASTIRRGGLDESYEWIADRMALLESALRVHALREILLYPVAQYRPGRASLRLAGKSRAQLYRLAVSAYWALEDVERLREDVLRGLFSQTVLPILKVWQRFELAVALAVTEALSDALAVPVKMAYPLRSGAPMAEIGEYAVLWQRSLPLRPENRLDESERLVKLLLDSLSLSQGAGRADIVVCRGGTRQAMALVECKWFQEAESAQGAAVDACTQLVRYARDLHPSSLDESIKLLSRSAIVVTSRNGLPERMDAGDAVKLTDLEGLESESLMHWAANLVSLIEREHNRGAR
jgi:hypothetical protein